MESQYICNVKAKCLRLENTFFLFFFKFLLLFNYSCMPFLPIPPPHPS